MEHRSHKHKTEGGKKSYKHHQSTRHNTLSAHSMIRIALAFQAQWSVGIASAIKCTN